MHTYMHCDYQLGPGLLPLHMKALINYRVECVISLNKLIRDIASSVTVVHLV